MLINKPSFSKEARPMDCWDWIAREDVIRHAAAAYEYARRESKPPRGERFLDSENGAWSSRESFAETMTDYFSMRIMAHANQLGIGDFANEARRLALCDGLAARAEAGGQVATNGGGMGAVAPMSS